LKLPWRQSSGSAQPPVASPEEQKCPTLGHALESLFRQKEKPEILDLGPLCGDTLTYLANRGARVAVEEIRMPPAVAASAVGEPSVGEDEAEVEPITIDQADERFDLVLGWEALDFIDDARLDQVMAELCRVLVPGGRLLFIAMNNSPTAPVTSGRRARYRVTADDQVVREELQADPIPRWCRPTRDIERSLSPLKVEKLHLHRNQTREFLAMRPASTQS
jgi:2-polyprenyl-3-methyl-5-hydroxy-6-metoxy-1,4-benzoquinol methylase